jgi:hypothetical protein
MNNSIQYGTLHDKTFGNITSAKYICKVKGSRRMMWWLSINCIIFSCKPWVEWIKTPVQWIKNPVRHRRSDIITLRIKTILMAMTFQDLGRNLPPETELSGLWICVCCICCETEFGMHWWYLLFCESCIQHPRWPLRFHYWGLSQILRNQMDPRTVICIPPKLAIMILNCIRDTQISPHPAWNIFRYYRPHLYNLCISRTSFT